MFRKISLLVLLCCAALPWRVAGQCSFIDITGPNPTYWSSNASKSNFYTVKNGAVLYINNAAVITFTQSCAGIRVETGGYLIVENNARLTSDGSGTYLWKGIEIQAHNSNPSASFSNCTIEHAQVGVTMTTTHINLAYYAPCANFTNCSFLNNKVGIYYWGFTTVSPGCSGNNITNCTFAINSSVSSVVTNPVRFIEMSYASYLNITGTTFQDALSTIDAQGINKQGGGPLEISGCTFTGVDKGIYLQGSSSSDKILNNTFTAIPAITVTPCCGYSWGSNYGIWAVGSSKFRIEGNSFTGTSRLNANKIYGVATDNSGASGALMFKNTFTNTSEGFRSQNNNSNYAVSCNTFTNYTYSGSRGPAWNTYNGSLRTQGNNSCSNSSDRAGNEWTSTCTGSSVVDIKVNASSYFHYYGHFRDQTLGDKTRPECSTTAWEPTYVVAHYCASGSPGYDKSPTACDVPFYTCPGCRLTANDLGIDRQLLQAREYYRGLTTDFDAQLETDSRNQYALEQAAHYAGLEQLVSNEITGQLMQRSLDTAILYLESSDLLEDKKLLAELYLSKGAYKECRGIVDNISAARGWRQARLLNAEDVANYPVENSEFTELFSLLLTALEGGRQLNQLTDAEVAALEKLSASSTVTGPKACAFLKFVTGKECSYEIYYDDGSEAVEFKFDKPAATEIAVSAFPNPANDKLTISVYIPESEENPELTVFDITGKEHEKIMLQQRTNVIELNTSAYPEGIYLLKVTTLDSSRVLRFSIQK